MTKVVSSNFDVLLYFIAIVLPPVSVFCKRGCAADFWINILLCILGWIPGVLHAWYTRRPLEPNVLVELIGFGLGTSYRNRRVPYKTYITPIMSIYLILSSICIKCYQAPLQFVVSNY
ncbi:hypothetical protein BDZ94DRAFT_990041 [Collybia nuda]|uniref:Plasma membrane proteolipid 3 n=1 Tax=Collybia nuda TaxID=64659 RepID=A0A9P5Y1P2_9AGAR|nr:hypothetical protein BDZ94DRAFT_990041 [Collybia nuda]